MFKIRKKFLVKALLLPILGTAFLILGFEHGYSAKGYRYLKLRKYDEAIKSFSMANDKKGLGYLYLKRRMYSQAEAQFNSISNYKGLGIVALRKRDFKKAMKYFKRADDHAEIGLTLCSQHKFKEALEELKKDNNFTVAAHAYMGMGQYRKAIKLFEKAHNYFLKVGNKVKALQCLREKKDKSLAINYAQKAISEGEMVPELRLQLGEIYRNYDMFNEAEKQFREVMRMEEMQEEGLFYLGRLQVDKGDYQSAKDSYGSLLSSYPETKFKVDAQRALKTISTLKSLLSKNNI